MGGTNHRDRRARCGVMTALKPFPADWQSMLVLMPHPDDPE